MIVPIKRILLEYQDIPEAEILDLVGRINSFEPFVNCSEEQDRGYRVKRDMIALLIDSKQAYDNGAKEWYGNFNDANPNNPNNPNLANLLTEGKAFNVGPSLGQKFMTKVNNHITEKKATIKKDINAIDKLQELYKKPGFGNIDIKPENPPISAHSNPTNTSFKSNKIEPRDKTNPYEPYLR